VCESNDLVLVLIRIMLR